jgi:hypothetical protein
MRLLSKVCLVFTNLALILSFILASFAADPSTWNFQVVDSTAVLSGVSLSLDSTGKPCMAYIDTETGSSYIPPLHYLLKFASWNGSIWNIRTIDTENVSTIGSFRIGYSSLAFDSENHAHIVYGSNIVYPTGGLIKYAHWTGNNWTIETVDTGARACIAIDSSDNPHIAYAGKDGLLKYASLDEKNWTIQTVDPQSSRPAMAFNRGEGSDQYLAIDSHDKPFILYAVNSTIKLAVENQSGWSIKEVISDESLQLGNLVLDSNDNPHFTYAQSITNNSLFYAFWDGLNWSKQKVSAVRESLDGSFIDLDSSNNPHISFIGNSPAPEQIISVYYARKTSSDWEISRVTGDYMTDYVAPLVVDLLGNPHIGYLSVRVTGRSWLDATVKYETLNQSIPTLTPSPTITVSPSPSPSVPELPNWWITLPFLTAAALTMIVCIKRRRRVAVP